MPSYIQATGKSLANNANSSASERVPDTGMRPAKRCSDFDDECIDVVCHYTCWQGGTYKAPPQTEYYPSEQATLLVVPQADGYCPYLIGQLK